MACWIIHRVMHLASSQTESGWKGSSPAAIPHGEEQEIRRIMLHKLQRRLQVKTSPRRREAEALTPPGD
jgi:hypothetical protein